MTIHRIEFKWFLKWLSKKNEIILCLVFGIWYLERMSTIALISFAALSCNALWKGYTGFCKTIFVDIFYRYIYSLLRKLLKRIYLSRFRVVL